MELVYRCEHCEYETKDYTVRECPDCADERARIRRQFGNTDLDRLAKVIYETYHGNVLCDPWTTYGLYEDDVVVQDFRDAAEAAMDVFNRDRYRVGK